MITEMKLKSFITVAEELNFTKAAEKLYVSQQSLSHQIRELEKDVGEKLFVRTSRHVALTQAGNEFYAFVKKAFSDYNSLKSSWISRKEKTLRIACFENLNFRLLLFQTKNKLADEQNEKILISSVSSQVLALGKLDRHELDAVIIPDNAESLENEYEYFPIAADQTPYAYISKSFPNAEGIHSLDDIFDATLFVGPPGNPFWSLLSNYYRGSDHRNRLIYDPNITLSLEKTMVEAGEAVGFGGKYSILADSNELIPIPLLIGKTTVLGVWRKENHNELIRQYFICLKKLLDEKQS